MCESYLHIKDTDEGNRVKLVEDVLFTFMEEENHH